MKWKLTKYEWDEESKHMIIGRQWYIEADRIEVEGHSLLRAYRALGKDFVDHLVYICRDWDEVDLVEES